MSTSDRSAFERWQRAKGRVDRRERKQRAAAKIANGGVIVTKAMVKNHRYLRDHGLPHSESVASVLLPRRAPKGAEFASGEILAAALAAASLFGFAGGRRRAVA